MSEHHLGISFGLRDDLDLVQRAEELGYESVWTGEGQGKTAFGKLERWAMVTETVDLGAAIVNIYSRSPATVAQSAATLDAHSGGRVHLGLGVAHPGVVEGFHGMNFDRPLARMTEYITLVRRYLSGEAGGYDGEFFSPSRAHFWEAFEPEREKIPIYNAALGPANVRLTGEYADGWIPYLYPRGRFQEAQEWLAEGAARAGRDRSAVTVVLYLLTSVAESESAARLAAARHVVNYLRGPIPGYYEQVARESGFEADVAAAQQAETLDDAAGALSAEFVESVALVGTGDQVRAQLGECYRQGADVVIVRPPESVEGAVERTMEALAPDQ